MQPAPLYVVITCFHGAASWTEKPKLDLSLVLPDVAEERDACVWSLPRLFQAEGLEKMHLKLATR